MLQAGDEQPPDQVPLLQLQDQGYRFPRNPLGPDDDVRKSAGGIETLDATLDIPVGDLRSLLDPHRAQNHGTSVAVETDHRHGVDLYNRHTSLGCGLLGLDPGRECPEDRQGEKGCAKDSRFQTGF